NQELEDFEVLYIDNNSEDSSREEINRLTASDNRVKLFVEEKAGAAAARNKGISLASGDYIYLLDVDDEIYPNALNSMIQILDTHPKMDAVFGKMIKSYKG